METATLKNKIILFEDSLWVIDSVIGDKVLMSKLESNADVEIFDMEVFKAINFDFEKARLDAVDVMNQTRYYDNQLFNEPDNIID